jgi:hypothetical protein
MNFFLGLVKEKESAFIRFLPILCSFRNQALSSNQLYLSSRFLADDAGFFPKFRFSDDSMQVLLTLPPNIAHPMTLEELDEECSPLLVDYIVCSVDLTASLCMGRCAAVIQTVHKVSELGGGVMSTSRPWLMRSSKRCCHCHSFLQLCGCRV